MRISINSGAFSTCVGLAGGGAAWAMPDARWLGYTLIAVAVIIFGFNVRVERSEVRVGRGRMWLYYVLAASALVFITSLLCIVLHYDPLSPDANATKTPDTKTEALIDDPNRPTLFDLFMSDLSGKSLITTLSYPKEMVFLDGKRERFYANHYYQYDNNTNFLAFYLDTKNWQKIVKYIAHKNKEIAGELPPFGYDAKAEGDSNVVRMDEMPFSGRIYIYVPTVFDVEEIGNLTKLGRDNGCYIQFRGTEYEATMKDNLRKYHSNIPPHYTINNGIPNITSPEIKAY